MYPGMRLVHVFLDRVWACQLAMTKRGLDNARYHTPNWCRPGWLGRTADQAAFVPAYCPHLNWIERLWGLMHRHITHNKCYATFREFSTAMLTFLREEVSKNWHDYCDEVTDNLHVITSGVPDYRVNGVY